MPSLPPLSCTHPPAHGHRCVTVGTTKLATVSSSSPTSICPGTAYPSSTCSPCANLGTGVALSGSSAATCGAPDRSPCCNFALFYLEYVGVTSSRYAMMEFSVVSSVRSLALSVGILCRVPSDGVRGVAGPNSRRSWRRRA
jgi:hypothetical protein